MLRKIVMYGDPVLTTVCEPVPEKKFGTQELQQLVEDMFETMYEAEGVGLAAPQIGITERLTVIDCTGGEGDDQKHILINPEIIATEGSQLGIEGCLSIPTFKEKVERPMNVKIRARNVDGIQIELEGRELLARVICHENDHLNGILFLEHISRLKREIIKRKIRTLKKRGEWD